MGHLSPHFTYKEMTFSQTAVRAGIDNKPNDTQLQALELICHTILEPVRKYFDLPFSPSSGFRNSRVNALIGSKPSSQHIKGQAVDFIIPMIPIREVAEWIESNLNYDQLIIEHDRWIHVSYVNTRKNRKEFFEL
jgi:hypothetical protein